MNNHRTLFGGARIDKLKPPIPDRVTTSDGSVVLTGDDIRAERQSTSAAPPLRRAA